VPRRHGHKDGMEAPLQELRVMTPGTAVVTAAVSPRAPDAGSSAVLRVAFHTLGCRLNQYDTESIRLRLSEACAMQVVAWNEPADLYVLNSCTVTAKAEHECRRLARQAKQRHPGCRVVVAGCYAQTGPDALAAIVEIDGVVGNTLKEDVAAWLPGVMAGEGPRVHSRAFAADEAFTAPVVDAFPGRSRAFVKIQDGCDLRCTYCAIWQARGPGRSRTVDDVIAQLSQLRAAGYREAVLAGVHLGGWGRDLDKAAGTRDRLPELLRRILAELPDLRLRLSSIHPNEVREPLLELYACEPRLRPHLHLSLQSGSDDVLRRMKRPYRAAGARRAVDDVAALGTDFGIGADFIVGFPGETDAEFNDTLRLVEQHAFSYVHVFRYSARPGTVAAAMTGAVPSAVIGERAAALREASGRKRAAFRSTLLGSRREAVVEHGTDLPGFHQATTDNYETVMIPAVPGDGLGPGALVTVRPDHEQDGRLFAATVQG
jgi:threonylcarbamoyladenosine tRNA methylthiotransferase MtaB